MHKISQDKRTQGLVQAREKPQGGGNPWKILLIIKIKLSAHRESKMNDDLNHCDPITILDHSYTRCYRS